MNRPGTILILTTVFLALAACNDGDSGGSGESTAPPYNTPPIAAPDTANTILNTAVSINVLANDSDPEGDPLSVSSFTQGASGSVTDQGGGVLSYTPNSAFYGNDGFTYEVSDGKGGSSNAAVTIAVAGPWNLAAPVKPPAAYIKGLATGDFNADGRPDYVTSVGSPIAASVRLNESSGGALAFGNPTNNASKTLGPIAVADFNGDGLDDFAAIEIYVWTVRVFFNDSANPGTFIQSSVTHALSGVQPATCVLVAGDLNQDGQPDLVVSPGNSNIHVFINSMAQGATTSAFAAQTVSVGSTMLDVELADLNDDGKLDIVAAEFMPTQELWLFVNTSSGGVFSLSAPTTLAVPAASGTAARISAVDVNSDGCLDLICACTYGVTVWANQTATGGGPQFATGMNFPGGTDEYLLGVVCTDVNGDNRPDIIATGGHVLARDAVGNPTDWEAIVRVWYNASPTSATSPQFSAVADVFSGGSSGSRLAHSEMKDFNGDGKLDLIAVNDLYYTSPDGVYIFLGQ